MSDRDGLDNADGTWQPGPERQPEAPTDATKARQRSVGGGPKWEASAKKRLSEYVRGHLPNLQKLKAEDANEATIRLIITDLLNNGFGYDLIGELAPEFMVRGEFADYGVRVDKDLVAFVEVKRPSTRLDQKHLKQVQSYAVNEGVEWLWLTNGAEWQVWHLTGGLPVKLDRVFTIDLLDAEPLNAKIDQLFLLTRESMGRKQIDAVWNQRAALSAENLREVLMSEEVLTAVRRQLRKTTDYLAPVDDLNQAMRQLLG